MLLNTGQLWKDMRTQVIVERYENTEIYFWSGMLS